jgi:hypothetical protein
MGGLPWVLIPTFIVPLLILTHVAVYRRMAAIPVPGPHAAPRATATLGASTTR